MNATNSADANDQLQQQLIDQVLADVVTLRGRRRRVDVAVVADQFRVELVGLPLEEPVKPIEPACQRPLIERTGGRDVGRRSEMPLPGTERGIPLGLQQLGDRRRRVRDVTQLMREPRPPVRHTAHAGGVL